MRKVKQAVPLAVAKARALEYLNTHHDRLNAASSVAYSIWPTTQFRAQGAGGAASRILKLLADEKLAVWTVDHHGGRWVDWGWAITKKGRATARRQALERREIRLQRLKVERPGR